GNPASRAASRLDSCARLQREYAAASRSSLPSCSSPEPSRAARSSGMSSVTLTMTHLLSSAYQVLKGEKTQLVASIQSEMHADPLSASAHWWWLMNSIRRFALEQHEGSYENWPLRSRLFFDGEPTRIYLPGYVLLHQF